MMRLHRLMMLLIGTVIAAAAAGVDDARIEADLRVLTAEPHRLTGSPACARAADHLARRLREAGLKHVWEQTYRTAVLKSGVCELTAAGRTFPLHPARPNGIVPPSTTADGVTGPLVYVGSGDLDAYPDQFPPEALVLMDYASGDNWRRAFQLGAQAVVFAGDRGQASREHSLSTEAPANFVRAYYDGPAADLPVGQTVTLRCAVTWEPGTGRNVIAMIPGTDPVFDQARGPEALVLAAPLDSFGEVPTLAAGARAAANAAVLLEYARALQENPVRRHVIIAFFDSQAWGHGGASLFYRLLEDPKRLVKAHLSERIATRQAEQTLITALTEQFSAAYPPAGHDHAAHMRSELMDIAADHVDEIDDKLHELRLRLAGKEGTGEAAIGQAEKDALQTELERLTADKFDWNGVRRHLNKYKGADATWPEDAAVRRRLEAVLDDYTVLLRRRQVELAALAATHEVEQAMTDTFGTAWLALHLSMMLGDTTGHWGLVVGDGSLMRSINDMPGLYAGIQTRFLKACEGARAAGVGGRLAVRQSMDLSDLQGDAMLGTGAYTHSGSMAGRLGIYNLAIGTLQDGMWRLGTPADTTANLKLDRLTAQADDLLPVLRRVADDPALSLAHGIQPLGSYLYPTFRQNRLEGSLVLTAGAASAMPNRPVRNAIVIATGWRAGRHAALPGFNNFFVGYTDGSGTLQIFAPTTTLTGFAATFDRRGAVDLCVSTEKSITLAERVHLYPVRHGALIHPPTVDPVLGLQPLDGPSNGPLPKKKTYSVSYDGVTSWYVEKRTRSLKLFGSNSSATVGLTGSGADGDTDGTGIGVPVERPVSGSVTGAVARDLWVLNEARLASLRKRGIMDSSLEELHGRAEDLLRTADTETNTAAAEAARTAALALQHQTYETVRSMLNDLVKAVLFLLALCVPFAFALERLLIGSTRIYAQLTGFIAIFLVTFLLLYISHPAFAIANTPVIIFLGFAVVVLSSLVIVIIMRKFETELRILQGMESTLHSTDVSRVGTILAAMSMGISSMRRRPLRTALTAVTIILLTFTILGFASFGTKRAVLTFFVQPATETPGVFIRQLTWKPLTEDVAAAIRGRWAADAPAAVRRWGSSTDENPVHAIMSADGQGDFVSFAAILGIDRLELDHRPELAALLASPAPHDTSVWVTTAAAARAGVVTGDSVWINGRRLVVGQLLDPTMMLNLHDMDGSSILPVDFSQAGPTGQLSEGENLTAVAAAAADQSWQPVNPDAIMVVGGPVARRLGAKVSSILFYPSSIDQAEAIAEEIARAYPLPVAATRTDGVYRHILGTAIAAAGLRALFFPILLGGLVVFGTMLGSVADREREIYTFSALGLAPIHVAGLFFAEALIYSVMGGMGGYLLAQGGMKVLELLAAAGAVRVPEMNYSSTNAIVTLLIVMLTVVVSAIYPALKASRSANPGVMRTWRVPEADGDVLALTFPFTVSRYDITGVVSFIREHLDAFNDVGLGVFMTIDSALGRVGGSPAADREDNLKLDATMALAPFDLGVTQAFSLQSVASEIEGIDEVAIHIVRRSGQNKDWQRQNRVFLDDLRRQFLLWRALPPETMELYRRKTLQVIGGE